MPLQTTIQPVPRPFTHSATRLSRVVPILAALTLQPALGAPRPEHEACRSSALQEDSLTAVTSRGEFVLASGARAVLADVHWPESTQESEAARDWLLRFRDRGLTLSTRGPEDRWGRIRVDAVADPLADTDEPIDFAESLTAAGLVAVDVGESDALCRPDLLAVEAAARSNGLGLWQRDPVRDARDGATLAELAGRFVVARARVVNVGERSARTYLDFAHRGEAGLTVTVPKRTWRIMLERGLTAQALRGRVALVRGRIEIRRGPTLDIASADMIEVERSEAVEPGMRMGEAARTR